MGDNQIYLEDIEVGVQIQPKNTVPGVMRTSLAGVLPRKIGRDFIMTINSPPRFSI